MAEPLVVPLSPSSSGHRTDDGPVPLSFPALLVNPRAKTAVAPARKPASAKVQDPLDPEGKTGRRRRRRAENDLLAGNPHIVKPSGHDLFPCPPEAHATFPAPPPSSFARSAPIPSVQVPGHDAASAEMGKFHRSLKGVRRSIRRIAGNGEACRGRDLVELVDHELRAWLAETVWRPEALTWGKLRPRVVDPTPFGEDEDQVSISELSRAPQSLTWAVPDPFVRFVVHCTARYYGVVSFGKTNLDGERVILLMRPLSRNQTGAAAGILATPPASGTDVGSGTEDDGVSSLQSSIAELDVGSTADEEDLGPRPASPALSAISDASGAESEHDGRTPRPISRPHYRPVRPVRSRPRSTSSSPTRSLSPQKWAPARARRLTRRPAGKTPTAARGPQDVPVRTMLDWVTS